MSGELPPAKRRRLDAMPTHCPGCQMPLADPSWGSSLSMHLDGCLAVDRSQQLECPHGANCQSTSASHFLGQTHYVLARLRCTDQLDHSARVVAASRPTTKTQSKITAFFAPSGGVLRPIAAAVERPRPPVVVVKPPAPSRSITRSCPAHKKLPDVPFVVDAFSYGNIPGVAAYFLTHFHSDHYGGLSGRFRGHIYCSQVTANLVRLKFGIASERLHPLPLDAPNLVHGVHVSLLEANHCPGSVMFLFRYADGRVVLHTGDFRAAPNMETTLAAQTCNRVDLLYLDTTYCQPSYDFPTQLDVLHFVVTAAQRHLATWPQSLVVCGSYTIGKEKVFLAIAQSLGLKVWVPSAKRRLLQCLEDADLDAVLTTDASEAQIHVLGMWQLTFKGLQEHQQKTAQHHTQVLAFRPSGWEHRTKKKQPSALSAIVPNRMGNVTIYGVPYSEHCSFGELRRFVQLVKPKRVIPTVNVWGKKSRQQMDIIASWLRAT